MCVCVSEGSCLVCHLNQKDFLYFTSFSFFFAHVSVFVPCFSSVRGSSFEKKKRHVGGERVKFTYGQQKMMSLPFSLCLFVSEAGSVCSQSRFRKFPVMSGLDPSIGMVESGGKRLYDCITHVGNIALVNPEYV